MAFDIKNLVTENLGPTYTPSGGVAGGTNRALVQADFITDDAPAVVEAANYFTSTFFGVATASRLPLSTMIRAIMSAGTVPVLKIYVVTANDGTNITLTLQKVIAG